MNTQPTSSRRIRDAAEAGVHTHAASVAGKLEAVFGGGGRCKAKEACSWLAGGRKGYYVGCCAHGAYGVSSASPLSHICRSWREEHRKRNFLPRIVESTAKARG